MPKPRRHCYREAFFLGTGSQRRFALTTFPDEEPVGALLFVPPFAEEMNRCRRMVALAAQHFARHGWLVIQLDLKGTGDSAGEFGQSGWLEWIADLDLAWDWLRTHSDCPRVVWSLRAGSLLAASWLQSSGANAPLLLWQPVTRGDRYLNQFLRYRAAAELLENGQAESSFELLKGALNRGDSVEIAGYSLSPGLADGLESSMLELPVGYSSALAMFEVTSRTPPVISPGVDRLAKRWRESSIDVMIEPISGPSFWQSKEIEVADGLLAPSCRALRGFSDGL